DAALFAGLQVSAELSARAIPGDSDGDGLTDEQEMQAGTNPNRSDTDGDGIPDGVELRTGTNPSKRDTDSDGVPDGQEGLNRNGRVDPDEMDPRRPNRRAAEASDTEDLDHDPADVRMNPPAPDADNGGVPDE